MMTKIQFRATGARWVRILFAAAVTLPLIIANAAATVFTIDFESEAPGPSADSVLINTGGVDFIFAPFPTGKIAVFDPETAGTSTFPRLHPSSRSLGASDAEGLGALVMGALQGPLTSLSFEIGFDVPADVTELFDTPVTSPTVALLFGVIDGSITPDLDSVVVLELNRNYLVDQTISYSGAPHKAFIVVFAIPTVPDEPSLLGYKPIIGPAIVIDNVRFEIADAVPTPAALPLLIAGLAGLGLARRRWR